MSAYNFTSLANIFNATPNYLMKTTKSLTKLLETERDLIKELPIHNVFRGTSAKWLLLLGVVYKLSYLLTYLQLH